MLKLKMMLCVMMLPLVVVSCIKAVCQSVREATTASGVDNAASPDWQTPLNGLFHPQREADHYAKTTGRNPSILMSSADKYPYRWATHAIINEQYTRFQRSINA